MEQLNTHAQACTHTCIHTYIRTCIHIQTYIHTYIHTYTHTHDRMVNAWHSLILSTGLRASLEPRGLYSDQRRPDIVIPDFQQGRGLHLDLSLTHPCLTSNVATASHAPGAAVAKRERKKGDLQGLHRFLPATGGGTPWKMGQVSSH